jgi:hypothetical protein
MSLGPPKVLQTMRFASEAERNRKLQQLAAQFRRTCEYTGLPLYKTASGVVLRLASATSMDVLSNCVC